MANNNRGKQKDNSAAKIASALRDLDINGLYDLYDRRRAKFLKDAEVSTHQEVSRRLLFAVVSIDACMKIYQEFLAASAHTVEEMRNGVNQYIANQQLGTDDLLNKSKELLQEVQSKEQGEVDELYEASVKQRIALYEKMIQDWRTAAEFKSSTHTWSAIAFTMSHMSTYDSLARLLATNDLSSVSDVLILVLQTLVGLIPYIGTLGSTAWGLHDILDKKAKEYKNAGDLLTQLDNFSDAALQWCIITQLLIELNEGRLSFADQNTDEIRTMLGEQELKRISRMVQIKIESIMNNYKQSS
ncbi:MAG: hypothetical protein MHPDNHAH_03227 [Anaerolineales bacterium]|nr:hypothetical protein [Anaerolineales bacterium]